MESNSKEPDNERQCLSSRRMFLSSAAATTAIGLAGCAGGTDEWPAGEIEIIEPYGTGGFDVYARGLAQFWEDRLEDDTTMTVRNQPGAGGREATTQVYNSDPDGYTIQIANIPAFVQAQLAFDTQYDLTEMPAIGQVHRFERVTTVGAHVVENSDVERGDFESFQEYVNSEGPITITTFGSGDATHIGPLIMEQAHDLNYEYAHYEDGPRIAVLQGEADGHVTAPDSIREELLSEDLIPIYITGPERVDWLDDVPTEEELGLEPVSTAVAGNRIFIAPPGMEEEHPDRLERLRETFLETCESDDFREWGEENERPINCFSGEEANDVIATSFDVLGEYEDLLLDVLG